jgi:hypothetical protein
MSDEPPLTEKDVDLYIRHLPSIDLLKAEPARLQTVLAETGWTEGRLAYVCSKVGLALLWNLDQADFLTKGLPPFAMPSAGETSLVLAREPDIARTFAQITRTSREKPRQSRNPSRRSR